MLVSEIEPVITETTLASAKKNWYTFKSSVRRTKPELKKAVEKLFKIKVLAIKTLVVKGKTKRSLKTRKIRRISGWKKVLVKSAEGQKIDLFDQA